MADSERARLAETRRLVFQNLANGVPMAQVMASTRLSEKEVRDHFEFVGKKIVEYRFQRALPYIRCDTITYAFMNRVAAFTVLAKFGDVYLTSDFRVSGLHVIDVADRAATEKVEEIQARLEGR